MSSQQVLINLKIRSLTVRTAQEPPARVDNALVRFTKVIEVAAIPKVGSAITLTAGADELPFECSVTRAEWDDRENMFVVACSYTKSPMSQAHYLAIHGGGDWTMKPLL
jgi:hypothetical protein